MSIAKLSGALPKGDGDGLADIAEEMVRELLEGHEQRPRVAIVLFDGKEAKVDSDGRRIAVIRVVRVEPITHTPDKAWAESALHRAFELRSGQSVLPFEMQADVESAFAGVLDPAAIDEREERQRERMSPLDELRQHLIRVHHRPEAGGMTESEVHERHDADHEDTLPGALGHDIEWHGWTRADIEAAEAESDDENSDDGESGATLFPLDGEDADESGGEGYPHDADPDLGKDLDDEDDQPALAPSFADGGPDRD